MTIAEFMETADEKTYYHIGAQSGFICVVTAEEYKRDFQKWDEIYHLKLRRCVEEMAKKASTVFKKYVTYEDKNIIQFYVMREDFEKHNEKRKKYRINCQELIRILSEWVPLPQREIKETYTRKTGGVAVIFKGTEDGPFWDRDEYVKRTEAGIIEDDWVNAEDTEDEE